MATKTEKRTASSEERARELSKKAIAAEATSAKRAKHTEAPLKPPAAKSPAKSAAPQHPQDALKLDSYDKTPALVIHNLRQHMSDRFKELTGEKLTLQQYEILRAVAHFGGCTQTHIVDVTGIDRTTTGDLIRRLGMKQGSLGFILRENSPTDERAYCLWLTDAGVKAYRLGAAAMEKLEVRVVDNIPNAETALTWARKATKKLSDGAGEEDGGDGNKKRSAAVSKDDGKRASPAA